MRKKKNFRSPEQKRKLIDRIDRHVSAGMSASKAAEKAGIRPAQVSVFRSQLNEGGGKMALIKPRKGYKKRGKTVAGIQGADGKMVMFVGMPGDLIKIASTL